MVLQPLRPGGREGKLEDSKVLGKAGSLGEEAMINHVEELFSALKRGCFPLIDVELEAKLRIAFTYGLDVGHQLTNQGLVLGNDQAVKFFQDLVGQIDGELKRHNLGRAKVKIGQLPANLKRINGSN